MSDRVPTVRVKPWAQSQGEFVEINSADFDAAVHVIYDEQAGQASQPLADAQIAPANLTKRKRGAR